MGKFKYEGINNKGKKVSGEIEGEHDRQVRRLLTRQGIKPTKIVAPSPFDLDLGQWLVDKGIVPPFTRQDLGRFTKQLATLINAGVPIMECLDILAKQEKSPQLKSVIKNIVKDVSEGKALNQTILN